MFHRNPVSAIFHENGNSTTFVFIGFVPDDVKNAVKLLPKRSAILQKYYGSRWKDKLYLGHTGGVEDDLTDIGDKKDVSFDFDFADLGEPEADLDDILDDILDDANNNADNNTGISVSKKFKNTSDTAGSKSDQKVRPTVKKYVHKVRYVYDIIVHPEDSALDFRKKLFALSGIQIYQMYIWYGTHRPLDYTLIKGNKILSTTLKDLDKSSVRLEGIPLIESRYNDRNDLRVEIHTHKLMLEFMEEGVTEFHVINIADYLADQNKMESIVSDVYKLELVYYGMCINFWPMLTLGMFKEYVLNQNEMGTLYPEVHIDQNLIKYVAEKERKVFEFRNLLKNKSLLGKIQSNLSAAVTHSTVTVTNNIRISDKVLSIRAAFDLFKLTEKTPWIGFSVKRGTKLEIYRKIYKNNIGIREHVKPEALIIKIAINIGYMVLIIYKNGNYSIKKCWDESKKYGFKSIINIIITEVNPVIKKLNSFDVFTGSRKLIKLSPDSIMKFNYLNMSVFYSNKITIEDFGYFRKVMTDFQEAGLVLLKSESVNTLEYFLMKGVNKFSNQRMRKFTESSNHFEFLSNASFRKKWSQLFEKTHLIKINHRYHSLKISISGIKEKEFPIFYDLIITMLGLYENAVRSVKSSRGNSSGPYIGVSNKTLNMGNNLQQLKMYDPVLFKYYDEADPSNVYSKKCQKPFQPQLVAPEDVKKYDANTLVRYWNFTTKTPAYYRCPNPKYPHMRFLVGSHPDDYCLPCCGKTPVTAGQKRKIYNKCLSEHKFTGEKKVITTWSKYIMTYGKDIETGRISQLPSTSLGLLFNATSMLNDEEVGLVKNGGKSLVKRTHTKNAGTNLNTKTHPEIIVTAAASTPKPKCPYENSSKTSSPVAGDLGYFLFGVGQSLPAISTRCGVFHSISSALGMKNAEFINFLIGVEYEYGVLMDGKIYNYFKTNNDMVSALKGLLTSSIDIENVTPWGEIILAIMKYSKYSVIQFEDIGHDVTLNLADDLDDYRMFLDKKRYIMILKKQSKHYPIYLINKEVYFKTDDIHTKIFNSSSPIILNIELLVKKYLKSKDMQIITTDIVLTDILAFTRKTGWKVKQLYVNRRNKCYYVTMSKFSRKISIPIQNSHYQSDPSVVSFTPFLTKFAPEFKNLMSFIGDLNKTLVGKYPVVVNKWIMYQNAIVGFIYNHINYYHKAVSKATALAFSDKPIYVLLYNIDEINQLQSWKTESPDADIISAIHTQYLWRLFMRQYWKYFQSIQNSTIRRKIKKIVAISSEKKRNNCLESLVCEEDYVIIKEQIRRSTNVRQIYKFIDESFYKFDTTALKNIGSTKSQIAAKLTNISKKIFKIGQLGRKFKSGQTASPKFDQSDSKFSNIVTKSNAFYSNERLIIGAKELKEYNDILADKLLNPETREYIFNDDTDLIVVNSDFISRLHEKIKIQLVD
jgi:hypothetical protein